jgi:single-stranded-DNA-specific exonuclease
MSASEEPSAQVRARFRQVLDGFGSDAPVWVLAHNDADGLSAAALFTRALEADGRTVRVRIVGRGEGAYTDEMRAELAGEPAGGIIITDLGLRAVGPKPGTPTLVVDHHLPQAAPDGIEVIAGHGFDPIPTSSLLAYWCAGEIADAEPWLWLAALGLIGDMADQAGFEEMEAARRYGITALRDAASLVNAPRRSASGDASPALRLLLAADGPKAITKGDSADAQALRAAKAEVKAELDVARRIGPKVVGETALIRFSSPTQIHPLIAQQWRGRLGDKIVMAANTGYRPGWVHFAIRSGADRDLVAFLAEHRPDGAGDEYGSGHRGATGGALRGADWNRFIRDLGYGPEQEVAS